MGENFQSDYKDNYTWFKIFGIFFPTITGVLSGINMSGDLRAPSTDIPNGTLAAFGTSSVFSFFCLKKYLKSKSPNEQHLFFFIFIQNILIFGICAIFGCNMWTRFFTYGFFDCTKSICFKHFIFGWCLCIQYIIMSGCYVWNAKVFMTFQIVFHPLFHPISFVCSQSSRFILLFTEYCRVLHWKM